MTYEMEPDDPEQGSPDEHQSRRERLQDKGRVDLEGSRAGAALDRLEGSRFQRPVFQSREDAVASLEARRAAKAEKKAAAAAARESRGVAAVATSPARAWAAGLLIVGAVGLGFYQQSTSAGHTAALREAQGEQSTLIEETEELDAIAAVEIDAQRQTEAIGMARGVGEIVRDLQNGFGAFDYSAGEFANWVELDDLSAEGGLYFSKAAQLGAKDPTRAWYVRWLLDAEGHNTIAAPADSYGWQVEDIYQLDERDQVSVVWLNRDTATGELLAWANGTYSYLDGVFTKVTVGVTVAGEAYLAEGDHNHDEDEELFPPGFQPPAATTTEQEAS